MLPVFFIFSNKLFIINSLQKKKSLLLMFSKKKKEREGTACYFLGT